MLQLVAMTCFHLNPMSSFISFVVKMSEIEIMCEICSQKISEGKEAFTDDPMSNTDMKPVICIECSCDVNSQSLTMKNEVSIKEEADEDIKPFEFVEFKDDTKIIDCVNSYTCEKSDEFQFSSNLKQCMNGKKLRKCRFCDFTSVKLSSLKEHMGSHTEKPYECKMCNYSSEHLFRLRGHMRIHTGEKPHKCTICDFACVQLFNLKRHMQSHSGDKQHKCGVCNFSSVQLSNLKEHMRIHTGEKPYKCKVCDYASAQASTLRQHVRTHTGEKPYKCNVCDHSFAQLASLNNHSKLHW